MTAWESIASELFSGVMGMGDISVWMMFLIGGLLIYLGVKKDYEPMLLFPMGVGCILANIPGHFAVIPTGGGEPGFLSVLYEAGIANELFPVLIFIAVGAMCEFDPLIRAPYVMLFAAAAHFGIFAAAFLASLAGFPFNEAASIGIIGAADGPTTIFVAQKFATNLLAPLTVTAFCYMSLVPIIQPPIMKLLTNKEERKIMMKQPRYVSRLEKIAFPIVMALIVNVFLPPVAPLITMLMLGNLLRECLVVGKLAETASNTLLNMVTLVLTVAIGSTMAADTFLTSSTILIIFLGLVAFAFGTGSGVVCAKIMNKLSGGRINPLIGSAGIASVPIAARVSHLVGQQESRRVFLLMHAMGPNLAGVFGTAISGGIMLALLGG